MIEINKIYCEPCESTLAKMPNDFIDLIITSPPYDNLRNYNNEFDFELIARELYRVIKPGGVVVWVTGDQVINKSESGTSFKQCLYFKEIGFNLHDTMIYKKRNPIPLNESRRYNQSFEYMFVLSKGDPKTANINQVSTKNPGKRYKIKRDNATSNSNGAIQTKDKWYVAKSTKNEDNIWDISLGSVLEYHNHPARFPEELVVKHIESWSNENDLIYDPFVGSGTTCAIAKKLNRRWIGSDISSEYCKIAENRINNTFTQQTFN